VNKTSPEVGAYASYSGGPVPPTDWLVVTKFLSVRKSLYASSGLLKL